MCSRRSWGWASLQLQWRVSSAPPLSPCALRLTCKACFTEQISLPGATKVGGIKSPVDPLGSKLAQHTCTQNVLIYMNILGIFRYHLHWRCHLILISDFDSEPHLPDCAMCWMLLFSLCPASAALSALLSSLLVHHLSQKTGNWMDMSLLSTLDCFIQFSTLMTRICCISVLFWCSVMILYSCLQLKILKLIIKQLTPEAKQEGMR